MPYRQIPRSVLFVLFQVFFIGQVSAATPFDPIQFRDQTKTLGIDFVHRDGRSGAKYFFETAPGGGGWMDIDNDGDLDLYLTNGALTPGSPPEAAPRNALFEQRDGRFTDITERSGTGDTGYGMGMCAGDIDGDGKLDFLVTNYGKDRLYRNAGGNRFEERAEVAGMDDESWSTGCAFGDVDGDGDLDLYVARYASFRFDANPYCGDRARGLRSYCRPVAFDGLPDALYINRGDGRFIEEASKRGIDRGADDRGFGVVMSDIDADGDLDIYVANDGTANRLYINDGKGNFSDEALISGVGLNSKGAPEAGMGVDLADVDGDGRTDILVTNYSMENNTLYLNEGDGMFDDKTQAFGLESVSFRNVGWGIQFFDVENDGDLDFAVANGHAVDNIADLEPGLKYEQANQLFVNEGGRSFVLAPPDALWQEERVSRGLALGDWNNDGRADLLVINADDRPQVLTNLSAKTGHWIGIRLHGGQSNPFAIGARVVVQAGRKRQTREVRSGGGYLTQGDLRLLFGLGSYSGPIDIEVHWPHGGTDTFEIKQIDRYLDLHRTAKN